MLCPYPDCMGQVTEGQNFCHVCGRPLDPASVALAKRAASGAPSGAGGAGGAGEVKGITQPISAALPQQPSYGNPQYQGAPPQYSPPQYSPPQYPPTQQLPSEPHLQGGWQTQGQPTVQMPVPVPAPVPAPIQYATERRGSQAPLIILLIVLLIGGGLVAGYFALGGKLPNFAGSSGGSSSNVLPKPQTFTLHLPVFDRDNNFVSDPINGSSGVTRRLTLAALPYSDIKHGQTSDMTSMEVAIQKGDKPDFSNDAIIMSIYFASGRGLAQEITSEMNTKYKGSIFQAVVPAKGQSYTVIDQQGWKLKITVDAVGLNNSAKMSVGSQSPYPTFTQLDVTAEVTPK